MNKTEINKALEECIVEKSNLVTREEQLILLKNHQNVAAAEREKYNMELVEVQVRLQNKQTELDLIRAVSSEKIRTGATASSQASKTVSPKKPKMGGLISTRDGTEAWTGGKPNSS